MSINNKSLTKYRPPYDVMKQTQLTLRREKVSNPRTARFSSI